LAGSFRLAAAGVELSGGRGLRAKHAGRDPRENWHTNPHIVMTRTAPATFRSFVYANLEAMVALEKLRRLVTNDPMQLVVPLVVFVVVFLAGWLVRNLILRAIKTWNARTESRAGRILYEALQGPLLIWSLMLAVHLAIESSSVPARYAATGASTLGALWILSLTVMFMRVVGDIVRFHGTQIPGAMPVTTLTQTLAQIAVLILGGLILLNHYNVSITPILTALGVGGLAVAYHPDQIFAYGGERLSA